MRLRQAGEAPGQVAAFHRLPKAVESLKAAGKEVHLILSLRPRVVCSISAGNDQAGRAGFEFQTFYRRKVDEVLRSHGCIEPSSWSTRFFCFVGRRYYALGYRCGRIRSGAALMNGSSMHVAIR